jgi:translin
MNILFMMLVNIFLNFANLFVFCSILLIFKYDIFINLIGFFKRMDMDFSDYVKEIDEYTSFRDELIKKSRDVLKSSKHLIYSIHRKDFNHAKKLYDECVKQKKEMDEIAKKDAELFFEGAYNEGVQEYVEAITFYSLALNRKIIEKPDDISVDNYIMGICDLTGEISRFAVNHAIERKIDDVRFFREVVEKLYGELLKFNLRNGSLRQKCDSVKYNLKNIENVLYELSLKDVC